MTSSPQPGEQPPQPSRRLWLMLVSRPVLGILIVVTAMLAGVSVWLWWFLNRELVPLVERNLSQLLNRPVELGAVERFSPVGIRFGASSIPPVVQQGRTKDADTATVQAVEVGFNLWDLLRRRTLALDVTLVQPKLYLEQAKDGMWLATPIQPQAGPPGPVQIELEAIRVRRASAVLVPFGVTPQHLQSVNGDVLLSNAGQQLQFEATGQVASGGTLQVQGQGSVSEQVVTFNAKTSNLVLQPIASLVPQLPFRPTAGQVDADLQVQYPLNQLPRVKGTAKLESVAVVVPDRLLLQTGRPQPRTLQNLNGTVDFLGTPDQRIRFDGSARLVGGGDVRVAGQASLLTTQADFRLKTQNLAAPVLSGAFQIPIAIASGLVDADLRVRLHPKQDPALQGTAQLKNITASLAELPQLFRNVNGQLQFQGLNVTLKQVKALYGQIPLQANGSLGPEQGYKLMATTAPVDINPALNTLELNLPFPTTGFVQAQNIEIRGPIQAPVLTGSVTALGTVVVDRVPFEAITARFRLAAPLLQVTDIRAIPEAGGLVTGQARFDVRPGGELAANLQTVNAIPGDAIAQRYGTDPAIKIGPITAAAKLTGSAENIQTFVQFRAPQALYPTRGKVLVRGGQTFLQDVVAQINGGTVTVNGQTLDQQWQATAIPAGIQLNQFSNQLQGQLSGRLNLSGTLDSFAPEAIRVQGQVRFSQGLSVIQQPLTAQIRWNGENIVVQQATAPGFQANGTLAVNVQGSEAPQITALNLNVQARNYRLADLQLLDPTTVQLAGLADLNGRLTGTPTAPNLKASLQLKNLAVQPLVFEPRLSGSLGLQANQGLNLQLAGERDRIQAVLDPQFQPESFYVRQGDAIAQGTRQGELLQIGLQQFPLAILNIAPAAEAGLGPLSGIARGNFSYHIATQDLSGTFTIDRPALGYISGDQFSGTLAFNKGIATLKDAELRRGNSQLWINARAATGDHPQFSGQVQIVNAQVQDILQALQIYDLQDLQRGLEPLKLSTAKEVQPLKSAGLPDASLLEQLQYFAAVQQRIAQREQQQVEQAGALPPLETLQGYFNGKIAFSGSQQTGINANFNVQGQGFQWGDYSLDEIVATGQLADGVLALQPLRLASQESSAVFTGRIGGQQQSGQLVLNNVGINRLNQLVNLPFTVAGQVNGQATLSGSLSNPQAQGQLTLANGVLNETPVQQAQATFNYTDGRLKLDSTALLQGNEPIQIAGSLPYPLPFADQKPKSDQLDLAFKVSDEGLALLNLFTDQVAWVDGQGAVDLVVQGTLQQPLADGTVTLNNATLKAQALPEPLTGVTGQILFDRDRLNVEQLTAQLSKGQVVATGSLPIWQAIPQENPLTVSLNNLLLKLENLYNGQVGGQITVTGAAFNPVLGGAVQLSNGQVLITQGTTTPTTPTTQKTPTAATAAAAQEPAEPIFVDGALQHLSKDKGLIAQPAQPTPPSTAPADFSVRLNNLQVQLDENVQITRPPVLSFVASGALNLNGELSDIRPAGTIEFEQGNINLFLTRFRLNRSAENFARFTPAQGLADPLLNLSLVTRVAEVTGARTTTLNDFEEVPPTALGAFETVRVEAAVSGQVSDLQTRFTDVVSLSSSPNRTEGELVSLIGGGFAGPLGEGDAQLAATTLASSVFINTLQGFIDDALGSRINLGLYPILIPNQTGTSVLSLGGELGYSFTNRFSVSVQQVLTGVETPTRFNINYQVSDRTQIRTGISANGEGVGVIEYRLRF